MPIWQWQGHYLMIKRGKTLSRNFLSKHINLMHESARHKKLTCLTYSKEHKVKISSLQWHLLNQDAPAESNLQNIEVSTNYFTHSLSWNRRTEYKKKSHGQNKYLPSNSKKFCKIMKLPMNIATNCHRAFHRLWLKKQINIFPVKGRAIPTSPKYISK